MLINITFKYHMLKQKAANVYNIQLSKTHICMCVDKKYIAWDTTFWRKKRASLLCCVEGSLDTISLQISKRKQGRQLFIYVIAITLTSLSYSFHMLLLSKRSDTCYNIFLLPSAFPHISPFSFLFQFVYDQSYNFA